MTNTENIVKELKLCEDFQTFYDENKDYMTTHTLAELLAQLLNETGKKKADVIHNSELSEVYGYQIFAGTRLPERKKLLALALAMELTLEQTQFLLRAGGYAPLYVKIPFDCVVMYGICKKINVLDLNDMLFRYGCETLA